MDLSKLLKEFPVTNLDREKIISDYTRIYDRAGLSFTPPEKNATAEIFNITGEQGGKVTARINGIIDSFFGFNYKDFIDGLDEYEPSEILLTIESPGGFVRDALAVYIDLINRKKEGVKLTTQVVGIAASAATLPLLAGEERLINEGSLVMIHSPMALFVLAGNRDEIEPAYRKQITALKKIEDVIVNIYSTHTSLTKTKIRQMLSDETWFDAEEAVGAGFSTEVEKAEDDDNSATSLSEKEVMSYLNKFV